MLYPIQNAVRNKLDLSGIWDFKIDPNGMGEQEGWYNGLVDARPIAVPGSWNEQLEDLYNYLGPAWYVTRTYVPSGWQGQRIFIRVGSANYIATVYINGVKVGSHEGGHLPFAFEITEHLRWGVENTIAIRVENELKPTRVPSGNLSSPFSMMARSLPTTFDFFPFAGIHRPVVLYSVPSTYIADITVVTDIEGTTGKVKVSARLNNAVDTQGTLRLDGGPQPIFADLYFVAGVATTEISVPQARFWSDKDPYLYHLTLTAEDDCYSLPIGIRTITVRDGQILLNGQPVKLNGFGRHEDFIASGKGLNLPLLIKDYHLMRWTGANAYRTAHYPYSEEEMQLADREGFLIIDETPAVSLQFDTEENMAERLRMCLQQLDELIARDKNHPCVVMWCVANEPVPQNIHMAGMGTIQTSSDSTETSGKQFLETLLNHARQRDPTRPVTLATMIGSPASWVEQCDVICMNRYWGWYVLGGQLDKARAGLAQELDATWEQWRRPIIMTEFGADTLTGMHGLPSVMWTEEYQAEVIRMHLEVASERAFIAGMQVWNFADFASVQSLMRVGGLNLKGVFTRTRQPKMAAHVLREFWVNKETQ